MRSAWNVRRAGWGPPGRRPKALATTPASWSVGLDPCPLSRAADRRRDATRTVLLPVLEEQVGELGLRQTKPNITVTREQTTTTLIDGIVKGKDFLRRRQYEEALKSFKRANEMREKKSAECFNLMAEAYLGLGDHKNVIESADKVIELAGEDQLLILKAYNNKGLALQASAEKRDQKKLQAAEAAFASSALYGGCVACDSLQPWRDAVADESRCGRGREINRYLKSQPNGTYVEIARKLAENPRRAPGELRSDFLVHFVAGRAHLTRRSSRQGQWFGRCL